MTRTTEAHAQGRRPRTDAELLAAVQAQRPDAFQDLRDRHWHTAVVVARLHSPSRQDAEQLAGTGFDQLLDEVGGGPGPEDGPEAGRGVFLRARLVAVVGRAGEQREHLAEPVSGIYLGLPASWQAVLWYLEIEGLELERTAAVLGLSPAATTALHLEARAGLRAAYRQARLDLPDLPGCGDCAADLGALADGLLPAERARAVQSHLADCPRCTSDHLYLQDTGRGLRTWLLPVLAGVPLWDTRTDELVELVRTAGRMSAGRLTAAPGTDVAGGALAAVHVSRRGRKVLIGAGALAAAAALAGVVATGSGGLGDGTTQATSRGGGSGTTESSAPSSSGTSDDGATIARGAGPGAAVPGGTGRTLSLPTLDPSPGPLTESAADRSPGTSSRAEGRDPDDDRARGPAASGADSSGTESSANGATGRDTAAAWGGAGTSSPSTGKDGTRPRDSLDDSSAPETPVVRTLVPEMPAGKPTETEVPTDGTSESGTPAGESPKPGASTVETPVPASPADETSAPEGGVGGGTSPVPGA